MKKLLTALMTLLMIFTLVGCNSNKEESTIDTNKPIAEQQEIVEESKQEDNTPEVTVEEQKQEDSTLEEAKPIKSVDPSQYSYWVVVYDQFNNEVSRTIAKYGAIVKDPSGKDVVVKGNTYFHTTIDYPSPKKKDESPVPSPAPTPTPDPDDVNYLYIKNYGSASSCIQFNAEGAEETYQNLAFQYSNDKQNWIDITFNTDIEIPVGETLYFKAKTTNDHVYYYPESGSSGGVYISDYYADTTENTDFEVGGSIMTLLDPTDTLRDLTGKPGCFYYLFYCLYNMKKADNLVFPATKLSYSCYGEAFDDCLYLESINPDLLPVTDLTGADYCCYYMFYDCESLKNAPKLSATTLCDYCYEYMFYDCYELDNSVVLPATTLANGCYYGMFYNCYLLDNIEVGFSDFDSLVNDETTEWLYNVASTGTFKWPGATTGVTQDESHVPSGWTITN